MDFIKSLCRYVVSNSVLLRSFNCLFEFFVFLVSVLNDIIWLVVFETCIQWIKVNVKRELINTT
jgi:hypothetical protein